MRERRPPPAPKASKTPLLAAAGAGLLLLAVGAFFALRPGPAKTPPSPAPSPALGPAPLRPAEAAKPVVPPPPSLSPEEAEWAAAKTEGDRLALVQRRIGEARGSEEASKVLDEFLGQKRRADLAE